MGFGGVAVIEIVAVYLDFVIRIYFRRLDFRFLFVRTKPGPAVYSVPVLADGFAVFEGEPGPHVLNPNGTVHGGWALTLIDSATGCAAHTLLPAGSRYATIETKGNLSRPITLDTGLVRAEGRVVSQGRQIISTEAKLLSRDGRILAHGTSTIMVLTPRPA